jgi:cytochrome c oxidase assembly factor CtaG
MVILLALILFFAGYGAVFWALQNLKLEHEPWFSGALIAYTLGGFAVITLLIGPVERSGETRVNWCGSGPTRYEC